MELYPTLCHLMDCCPPGSVGILHTRILEWVAMASSMWSSQPRDGTQIFHIADIFFTIWTTREAKLWMLVNNNISILIHQLKQRYYTNERCLSLVAQMVKNLPTMQETGVQSLSWEDPLEKGMATHSSIPALKIAWTEEPGRLQSMGSRSRTGLKQLSSSSREK